MHHAVGGGRQKIVAAGPNGLAIRGGGGVGGFQCLEFPDGGFHGDRRVLFALGRTGSELTVILASRRAVNIPGGAIGQEQAGRICPRRG